VGTGSHSPDAGPDCGVVVHVPLEVAITHSTRARAIATWLALTAVGACASGPRPSSPPPSPARAGAGAARGSEGTVSASPSGARGSDTAGAALATAAMRDSIDAAMRSAIEQVSALFDVPDSIVQGRTLRGFFDVDSTSNVLGDGEPTWDIDVDSYVTHDKVSHYVNLFLGTARGRFVERLQRGKQYEPMIREKFRAAGIPEDMYFLGLVESGYDPHAYSRAAAVGIWQFMSSTARGVGLRVDWWVDERRDPVRSTEAAARFISDLRGQFGSLYLAAAAYNGGPGRVSRGLKRFDDELENVSGEDCFFALAEQDYLRSETKNYVPQLIAAALIGKTPERYGISLDSAPRFAYDSAMVPGGTPLAAVAKALGVPVTDVQLLNPHLVRGVTPPGTRMAVRFPVGAGVGFDSAFAALPPDERVGFTSIRTKKNETLAAVAKRHGLTSRHLQWYNPKLAVRRGRLVAGQLLLVPSAAVVQGAFDVPDPSIERYGTSAGSARPERATHVVRRGESLGLIAKRYHTSVATLVHLNRLKKQVIYPGQSIIVRGGEAGATTASASSRSKGVVSRGGSKASAARRTDKARPVAKGGVKKRVAPAATAARRSPAKGASAKGASSAKGRAAKGRAAKGRAAKGQAAATGSKRSTAKGGAASSKAPAPAAKPTGKQ